MTENSHIAAMSDSIAEITAVLVGFRQSLLNEGMPEDLADSATARFIDLMFDSAKATK